MARNLTALRSQVELALTNRVAAPFNYRDRKIVETVSAGIPEIDALTGGLPRGGLTEICGPACSGRTSLLTSALASRTANAEVCALIDGQDAFDPYSAELEGVELKRLLWVRCKNMEHALRATDLLLQGGGFGMVALDLGDVPAKMMRYVPLNVWFRFRRAVEDTPTIFVVLEREANAKTCASLVLKMEAQTRSWVVTNSSASGDGNGTTAKVFQTHACLFEGSTIEVEMVRARGRKTAETSFLVRADGKGFHI